jgi:hypothetical protein
VPTAPQLSIAASNVVLLISKLKMVAADSARPPKVMKVVTNNAAKKRLMIGLAPFESDRAAMLCKTEASFNGRLHSHF